jgi:GNAT superfamily N-acetyltransferase
MNSSQTAPTKPKSERLYSRLAREGDLRSITDLINRAFANDNIFLLKERITLERVSAYLQKGNFLLLEEEGQLVGLRYVEFLANERAYVGLLSVDPDKQRLGLGRRLHEASEQFCREHGCKVIEGMVINLNKKVLERNRRLGYEVVGIVSSENFPEYAGQVNGPWHFIKIEKLLSKVF